MLEEYAGLFKLQIFKDPIQPTFKMGKDYISDFLRIKKGLLAQASGGDFSRYPIDFLIDRFVTPDSFLSGKYHFLCTYQDWLDKRFWVLALCLLAHLFFPRADGKVDMALIEVITQV